MLPKYRVGINRFYLEASADRYADKRCLVVQRTLYGYTVDILLPALLVTTLLFASAVVLSSLIQTA